VTKRIGTGFSSFKNGFSINGDNQNNIRRKTSRHFRNKKREYMKDKIDVLATNSKNKNIRCLYRGMKEFKKGYQPRSNLVKDDNFSE
jgi:hypothetical protein